jgi:glycerophosphoryl diester phosphodiesterase
MLLNVELKAGRLPPAGLVRAAVACLRRHSLGDRLIVSSFNPLVLAELALRAPDLPRAFLFAANQSLPLRRAWPRTLLRPTALHPEHVLANADRVREWHAQGYAVNCWTVDDPAALRRLAAAGVDGIIANDPGRARAALAEVPDSHR